MTSYKTAIVLLAAWLFPVFAFAAQTKTPIKHLVVIFQENRTFDHYFGTYPNAANNNGETKFTAKKNTPLINGLSKPLRINNQNLAQPFRLAPSQSFTPNPGHTYTVLQQACHAGLMDQFVQTTGTSLTPPTLIMGYFDGNTVTALWNYAQYFAMSDNFHTTNICGSTVGAINLISGQVHGAIPPSLIIGPLTIVDQATLLNDVDPKYDTSSVGPTVELTGINVGNLLNAKNITWGWFQGGFRNPSATHIGPSGLPVVDYIPHHSPFQYYQSTSNPNHLPPTSPELVGKMDKANHIYDISDFWAAVNKGSVPAVSFLKAAAYQDGHATNSSPQLEQQFLVSTINKLQKLPQWKDMAIIIAYDDSGGWYDHEVPPIINQSQLPEDAFVSPGNAGSNTPFGGYQGRIGYGFRVPFLVISPWAKENFVDSVLIDQTSILSFIEYNWGLPAIGDFSFDSLSGSFLKMFDFKKRHNRRLILNPQTGAIR